MSDLRLEDLFWREHLGPTGAGFVGWKDHPVTASEVASVLSDADLLGELVRRGVLVEGGSNQTAAGRWTWLQTESRWLAVEEPVGSVGETP